MRLFHAVPIPDSDAFGRAFPTCRLYVGESRKDSADEALHSCQPILHVRTPWRGYGRVVLGATPHGRMDEANHERFIDTRR